MLTECATLRDQRLVALNDIVYIQNNSAQFVEATDTAKYPLETDVAQLNSDLNTIATAASAALDDPKNASAPTNLQAQLPLTLPARVATPAKPQIQVQNYVGMAALDATNLIQTEGLISNVVQFILLQLAPNDPRIGHVVSQWPAPLNMVYQGSSVTIYVGQILLSS